MDRWLGGRALPWHQGGLGVFPQGLCAPPAVGWWVWQGMRPIFVDSRERPANTESKEDLGLIPRADRGRGALRPDSPPAGGEDRHGRAGGEREGASDRRETRRPQGASGTFGDFFEESSEWSGRATTSNDDVADFLARVIRTSNNEQRRATSRSFSAKLGCLTSLKRV